MKSDQCLCELFLSLAVQSDFSCANVNFCHQMGSMRVNGLMANNCRIHKISERSNGQQLSNS